VTPAISVIVPLHDGERFLGEALDSVAAQDYAAFEIIVIDDGSTDAGPCLAAARGLTVVRQEQRGVAAARNSGVRIARGEILTFLDQDDLWLPSKLRHQVEMLTAHPDCICLTQQTYFLESGAAPPAWFAKPDLLANDHAGWVPSCLGVRKKTFERVGFFDERLRHASDFDWFARATQKAMDIRTCSETLVRRRIHDGNESRHVAAAVELFAALRGAAARSRSENGA
jgi:glycosyltransferase involved in cell wall biosynthesis